MVRYRVGGDRRSWERLNHGLTEQHKTYAMAGNAHGQRWTPFQKTKSEIMRQVQHKPGITFREMMEKIKHHYASDATARSCIRHWIQEGVIPLRIEGRPMRLWSMDE